MVGVLGIVGMVGALGMVGVVGAVRACLWSMRSRGIRATWLGGATLLALSACVTAPNPSPPVPTPVPTAFVITIGDKATEVRTADDCAPISDAWLSSWCRDLAGYRPENLPSALEGQVDPDTAALVYAALAWSLLHGDASVCDNPVVGAFLAFEGTPPSPMPSPSVSPAQHCRDDLHITLGLAVTHGNRISLTSPETLVDATVALPDGRPLPALPAS